MSYSLIGILDVNMPMLYGEGQNAFLRLQEEIIKKYNDLSIFAWNGKATRLGFKPILASKPSNFFISPANIPTWYTGSSQLGNKLSIQFSLTNQGIFFPSAKLHYQTAVPGYRHHYLLSLNYRDRSFRGRALKQRYILLQKVGSGLFIRLHDPPERLKAFQESICTSAFYEPVCILNSPLEPMIRPRLVFWERNAVRLRWKPWEKLGRRYWHIRTAQPRGNWDLAANQFLVEMAYERYMHVEFVPGNYESNPGLKYFVLAIEVGDEKKRDPRNVLARIVSADIWEGITVTTLGFQKREALALEALPHMKGTGDSDHISLVGYDISVSVRLVAEPKEQPYHLVYLDWEATSSLPVTNE
jgi:hypothetical protein